MLNRDTMNTLIERIHEQLNIIYSKENYGKGVDRSILYPPAPNKEIVAFEKKANFRFPPSYHQFLELHNGWEYFWFNMTLTGISGKHTEKLIDKVQETVEWQNGVLTKKLGNLTPENIRKWESERDRNLYLPNHYCFATSFAGEFFVFDRRTMQSDGEMQVVFWNIGAGAYNDYRYQTFYAMLEAIAQIVEKEYKKLTKSKSGKKKK